MPPPSETKETLYEKAFAQDGDPIPVRAHVLVELIDQHGTSIETRTFTRADSTYDLVAFVGDYAASMAAEGTAGSVRWGNACNTLAD